MRILIEQFNQIQIKICSVLLLLYWRLRTHDTAMITTSRSKDCIGCRIDFI
ncbi:Uncharacterised protein [Segatella copri]|nr:Uncharacterised protein [Segatella copri]